MKVDLFLGAGVTGFNNYIYMNTSTMPSGWVSSYTSDDVIDTTWRSQPWYEKFIGPDSVDYYQGLGQGNYFITDPNNLSNKPYRGIVNLNADLFNLMVTINRKISIGLQVKHRSILNIDHVAPELVTLAVNELEYSTLWDLDLSDQLLNLSFNSWMEYNLSYAQVLKDDGEHFVKAGGKLKFLQGLGSFYVYTGNVEYNFFNADTANYITGDFNYGYSQNLAQFIEPLDDNNNPINNYDLNFNDIFQLHSKLGLGLDIGGVYEWRPNWEEYKYDMDGQTNLWRRDKNKYKLRASFSINDIGGMNYLKGDMSRDFTANLGIHPDSLYDLSVFNNINGFRSFDSTVVDLESQGDVEYSNDTKSNFYMNLPTSINMEVDYHIWNDFYVDARVLIGFQRNNDASKVRVPSNFSITPRYDYKYFGISTPLSYSGFYGFRAGLGLRTGPLFIGTADIKPLFAPGKDKNIKGANFYIGLRAWVFNKHPKDNDVDNVSNKIDECIDLPGVWEFKGCPDSDGDGIKDVNDDCPTVAGLAEFKGCPDTDGDKIIDKEDMCPEVPGLLEFEGCPDTDKDGLFDYLDQCPEIAGPEENRGCPWPDTDGDGLKDREDDCPNNPGPKSNNGCPYADTDGDGVLDKDDDCVNTPGPKSNNGCPVIEEEEQEILNTAFENLEFQSGKDIIKEVSFPSLEELANLLIKKSEWKLSIAGHTDNVGSEKNNLILSKKRAESVALYLNQRGVQLERLIVQYFGEEKPVDTNDTEEGRQKNRRVEMTIIFE